MSKSTCTVLALCTCAALLSACGGADTKTGSNGTGTAPADEPAVVSGALVGLGPLALAGASLQDASAQTLLNLDARAGTGTLRLGMNTNAIGTADSTTATGVATGAVAQSLLVGPVTSVDVAAGKLAALTLSIQTDQNTLLEGVNTLADLVPGDEVEVFGLPLPVAQAVQATRIIVRRPAGTTIELLGIITENTPTTVRVQGAQVNVSNARVGLPSTAGVFFGPAPVTAGLLPGLLVRVTGTPDGLGGILASTVASSLAPARAEGSLVYIEGYVTERIGTTRFRFPDLEVDGSAVAAAAGATVGARVRANGRMQGGILKAQAIEVVAPTLRTSFLLEGAVSDYTTLASLRVRGELVDASQAIFTQGTAASLANGKVVRIKGVAGPGRLRATEIAVAN